MATDITKLDDAFRGTHSLFIGHHPASAVFGAYGVKQFIPQDVSGEEEDVGGIADETQPDQSQLPLQTPQVPPDPETILELLQLSWLPDTEGDNQYPFSFLVRVDEERRSDVELARKERFITFPFVPLGMEAEKLAPIVLSLEDERDSLSGLIFPISKRQRDQDKIRPRLRTGFLRALQSTPYLPVTLTPYYLDRAARRSYFVCASLQDLLNQIGVAPTTEEIEQNYPVVWHAVEHIYDAVYSLAQTPFAATYSGILAFIRTVAPNVRAMLGRTEHAPGSRKAKTAELSYIGSDYGISFELLRALTEKKKTR